MKSRVHEHALSVVLFLVCIRMHEHALSVVLFLVCVRNWKGLITSHKHGYNMNPMIDSIVIIIKMLLFLFRRLVSIGVLCDVWICACA